MFFDLLPQMAGGKPARLVTLSAEELQAGDGLFTTWMISENLDSGDWRGGREPEVGFVWLASERPPGVARINGRRPQGAQVAPYDLTRPSSNHAGGVNGLFADGHFQFIAESIDYRVYRQLMTTNEAHARPVGLPAQ
jgi:prepilin-type processing-associated H-X9-DG protein